MSNQALYQQYYLGKGLTPTQVGGILLNIEDESGFNPNPAGSNDQGNSYGLFQHNGPRKRALFNYAGTSSPTWQQQLDFALTEPDMQRYLSRDYANYADAGVAFMDDFERPAKHHRDARAQKYRSRHSNDVAPDGYTVPMGAVGQGPAYQGQSIVPVSGQMPGAPQMPMSQMPAPQEQSYAQSLASSPLLQAGLGMMAGRTWSESLQGAAAGLQRAMANSPEGMSQLQTLQAQNELAELTANREASRQKRAQAEQRELLASQYDQSNPTQAALIRLGELPEVPQLPKTVNIPEGMPEDIALHVTAGDLDMKQGLDMARQRIQDRNAQEQKFYTGFDKATSAPREVLRRWEDFTARTDTLDLDADDKTIDKELVTAFVKMTNPTEAVMDGDIAGVMAAERSVAEAFFADLDSGGSLSGPEREDVILRMSELAQLASNRYNKKRTFWEDERLSGYDVRPDKALGMRPNPFEPFTNYTVGGAAPGTNISPQEEADILSWKGPGGP